MRRKRNETPAPVPETSKKKQRRPDVAQRIADRRYFNTQTIKCTINPFCKYAVVREEIEECVYWASRLQIHTHHVMNLLVLKHNGRLLIGKPPEMKSTNLYGLYNKLMRNLRSHLQGVEGDSKGLDKDIMEVCATYTQGVGLETNWPDDCMASWRGRVLEEMARQSATMHTQHLESNFNRFVSRYMKYLIRDKEEFRPINELNTDAYNKVFSAIANAVENRVKLKTVVERRPTTVKVLPWAHAIWETAQVLMERITAMVPEKNPSLSRKSEIMYSIMTELGPFSDMLQENNANTEDNEDAANNNENQGLNRHIGRQNWKFSLCPQLEWRPRHVTISNTAIEALVKRLAKSHSHIKDLLKSLNGVGDKKHKLWDTFFNMRRVFRPKHFRDDSQLRYGDSFTTDGVSVGVQVLKKKSDIECRIIALNCDIGNVNKILTTWEKAWWSMLGNSAIKWCRVQLHPLQRDPFVPRGLFHERVTPLPLRKIRYRQSDALESQGRYWKRQVALLGTWKSLFQTQRNALEAELEQSNNKYLLHEHVKDLAGLRKDKETGIFTSSTRIVGLDPGKKSLATWVPHDPVKQAKHQKWKVDHGGEKTQPEERYEKDTLYGGQWIFVSGQKQYTAKMNRRIISYCPEWRNLPTVKTVNSEALVAAYRQQVALWPDIERAFFGRCKWFQKQRMRRYCKGQAAMEDVVARITGTKVQSQQKKVIVAYGDGARNATMKGTAPVMSSKLFKKVSQRACVVLINEFRTSMLCSCCLNPMKKFNGQFRMKQCENTACIRNVWDRDVNASINILNLFLETCHSASSRQNDMTGVRPEAFERPTSTVDQI